MLRGEKKMLYFCMKRHPRGAEGAVGKAMSDRGGNNWSVRVDFGSIDQKAGNYSAVAVQA